MKFVIAMMTTLTKRIFQWVFHIAHIDIIGRVYLRKWAIYGNIGNIIGDHELWLRPSTIEPTVDYWLVYHGSKTFM